MGDNLATVKKIDRMVHDRFDYRREDKDVWDAYPETLLFSHDHVDGDCDDLAATVIAMSLCAGVPRSKLGLVITSSDWDNLDSISDHILGFYQDDNGKFWSIGDTKRRTTPLHHNMDRVSHWLWLDDTRAWRKNDPRVGTKIHVGDRPDS
ncbi:transglutaminase domain-containing protein [Salipiger mucosus]|uniref:Uncharacterized protein n=1 Tax=Salipiger mucosus DSM 16094 TaxID=1123237 RepID=S9SCF9_9RHOB|nr:transglutaminase domain-containing protein [Salipiger mucosus]EPX83929.1 hypothetical protein Salmuc_01704 [Salipiger mucosus DSM 16094]